MTLAKRASPPLTYASYGIASTSHVAGEMFKSITGAEMVTCPTRAPGPPPWRWPPARRTWA